MKVLLVLIDKLTPFSKGEVGGLCTLVKMLVFIVARPVFVRPIKTLRLLCAGSTGLECSYNWYW